MGGEELNLAEWRHAQLYARASQLLARDSLLDDSALLAKCADVAVIGKAFVLEAHRANPCADLRGLHWVPGRREAPEVDERFPSPETPSFSFTSTSSSSGFSARISEIADTSVLDAIQPLSPERMGYVLAGKEATAATLRSEVKVSRVSRVHRDPELEGEVALESRDVQGYQVGTTGIDDQAPYLPKKARSVEELLGQRPFRAVEGRDEVQALARVRRDHAREQGQVVVGNARQDRLRGH